MTTEALGEELTSFLYSVLTEPLRSALEAVRTAAIARHRPLYLAGGAVRDLVLRRPVLDLDLVIEGDALAIARAAGQSLQAEVVAHAAFGTATLYYAGFALDLVTARAETYVTPGALPLVRPATIADDLARRDFTVNAMALRLVPEPPVLLDPFGGRRDLAKQLIRVLHERSFQDDATRMLRAVRYAALLAFELEPDTDRLLRRDRTYLDTISGARILHELLRIFETPVAAVALRLAEERSLLSAIHPTLRADAPILHGIEAAQAQGGEAGSAEALLCLLASGVASLEAAASLSRRLALPGRFVRAVSDLARVRALTPTLRQPDLQPSQITALLEPFSPPALWAVALVERDEVVARRLRTYLEDWRFIRPELRGDDLIALGVPPGPKVGALLRRLRAARLDGLARSRADEIALVQGER